MTIIWKSNMSVGSKVIDNEHKYLFSLVNCALLAIRIGDYEVIEVFVEQLIDYAHEHFSNEEKLQLAINYPGYADNKIQHQKILENLEGLKNRLHDTLNQPHGKEVEDKGVEDKGVEDKDKTLQGVRPELLAIGAENKEVHEKLVEEISQLLRHWILEHVLKVDRKMVSFVSKLPSSKKRV